MHGNTIKVNSITYAKPGYLTLNAKLKRLVNDRFDYPISADVIPDQEHKKIRIVFGQCGYYAINPNGSGCGSKFCYKPGLKLGLQFKRYEDIKVGEGYVEFRYGG